MTAPNQVMISFRLPWRANSPPHKRISAKSNMKVTALVFLPGTWRSKWLWLKVCVPRKPEILSIDDIEDIENMDFGNIHLGGQCFWSTAKYISQLMPWQGQRSTKSQPCCPTKQTLARAGRMEHARVNDLYNTPLAVAPVRGVILGEMYLLLLQITQHHPQEAGQTPPPSRSWWFHNSWSRRSDGNPPSLL